MFLRLSEEESLHMLGEGRVARLGCIVDGGPYIVPINYYFETGCVYSHSLTGLKILALRENPKACLQVDVVESDIRWRSILAFGKYEEVTNAGERSKILNKLLHRFAMLTPVESAIVDDAETSSVIVFRVRIDRISGVAEN